jgi:hypothetical protein
MTKVILSHKVADYAKWRPLFDADFEVRKGSGFLNETVFRASDDPNHLYIHADIDDLGAFDEMMNDPSLAEKMAEAGVISEPAVLILNPA